MLIQFNFSNFKSFRDEVSLDLTATKITEHMGNVVEIANDKLLKVAAIYGANASGKTNVYEAFEFMTYYVMESFNFGGESDDKHAGGSRFRKVTPFLLDSSNRSKESTFEVFFVDKEDAKQKIYQYGFALLGQEVVEEWLYYKTKSSKNYKTIFYRKGQELDFEGGIKSKKEIVKTALEKEVLVVSLGAKLKINTLKRVRDWFLSNEVVNFGNPVEDLFRSSSLPMGFVGNENVQKNVVEYFSSFDEAILGFEVEEIKKNDKNEERYYRIGALHKMIDSEEKARIPLEHESGGTIKMFSLYPPIQRAMRYGSVLFVDELNAKLHPLLVRNIILTFLNPEINTNNAQLIFTTHDIWQLSNDLLRRDEIWFVEKDKNGVSTLYSLADFKDEEGLKIRKDENFVKNYMTGKYGAIPSLKPLKIYGSDKDYGKR